MPIERSNSRNTGSTSLDSDTAQLRVLVEEQRAGPSLVRGVGVAVQEAHRDESTPASRSRRAAVAHRGLVERLELVAVDGHAAADLEDQLGRTPAARGFTQANMLARRGMSWRPISSTSRKPAVVSRPVGAPLLSRIALVAVVVPCRT